MEMREQIARAIFESNPSRNSALQWGNAACPRKRYLRQADAILADIDKAGSVIVPREPTEEMIVQGAKAMTVAAVNAEPQSAVIFGQPKEVWQAMIDAVPKK